MHHPTDRIAHTTASRGALVGAQWVHPMKDRSDDPSHHERTLLPRSYICSKSEQSTTITAAAAATTTTKQQQQQQ